MTGPRRTCGTCAALWRGACALDDVVGTGEHEIEGEAQTALGAQVQAWQADHLLAVADLAVVAREAPPCPGWRRRG